MFAGRRRGGLEKMPRRFARGLDSTLNAQCGQDWLKEMTSDKGPT